MDTFTIAAVVSAYLVGAVPFGLLFARLLTGKDPRQHGSKNIGATNALRTGGKLVGILTLIADIVKGAVPVAIVMMLEKGESLLALVALAAFFGHIFPVYLGFKGGKGVATMFGVLIPWAPWVAVASFAVWLLVFRLSRYVSLASISAGATLPVAAWALSGSLWLVAVGAILGCVMIVRHHGNIRRLLAGDELKVGGDKQGQNPSQE